MKKFLPFFLAFFVISFSVFAQDTTYTDLGEAGNYNLFVIGNATATSADIQGRVAVGGNAHFTNYSIGDQLPNSQGSENTLVVGDSLWYYGGRVYYGNVVYGEFADVSDNLIADGEGTVFQGSPVSFSNIGLQVADISVQWKSLVANGSTENDNGTITLVGSNPSLNIFEVDGENLSSATGFSVNAPEGSTVLVNISGSVIDWNGDNDVVGVNQTHVVYNFYEADSIILSGIAVKGSILAPFAYVNFVSGQLNGNLIVHDFEGEGQVNYSWFQGTVDYTPSDVTSECYVTMRTTLRGYTIRFSEPFFGHRRVWAGTFLGEVNNHSTTYYCIDFTHYLRWNKPYAYDGAITGPIAYIIRNYYPRVPYTGQNGQLNKERHEAAAVQAAIWHFSDGLDAETITKESIRERALQIIEDATDQNPIPLKTFYAVPASQVVTAGQTAMVKIVAKNSDGEPMPGVEVEISTTAGTVVPDQGVTDANGELVVAVQYDDATEPESAEITVTTMEAALPPGSRYVYDNAQTLITNDELITCLTVTATVYWSTSALPGNDYDFYMYSTTNSSIPDNYLTAVTCISDMVYFGTANSGVYAFDKNTEEFEEVPLDNQNITAIIGGEEEGVPKMAVGFQTDGFAAGSIDDLQYFNSTNSSFTGSHVYAFDFMESESGAFLVIAHDAGVSLFNINTGEFTNYNSQNSDLPPGVCYDVTVDEQNGVWVATDYGLAHKFADGTWEVFTDTNSGINGNYIRAVEYGNGEILVGTFYSGLCGYDVENEVWTNYTPFISTQPVMNIFYGDDKFFIANWSEGLYVYDGENFKQYSSVSQTNAPSIIEDFAFDGQNVWFATQAGLSRTVNGSQSNGDAAIIITDNSGYTGGETTIACNLVGDGEFEFNRLSGTILFNNSELEFIDYALGETFSGCVVHLEEVSPGRIEFTAIAEEPITESGTMFNLMFGISENLAGLGEGISAVYCTDFNSGFGTELTHEDLGIINWTSSGTGNAGVGDASLDDMVDMTDYLKVIHHYVYGGPFELQGQAFINGDVDSTNVINCNDASKLLSFLDNGCFPFGDGGAEPAGGYVPASVTYDTENNEATVDLVAEDVANFNGITIVFEFDSNAVDYNNFSSVQIGTGDYVHATELTPGSATFVYNAPTDLEGTFELGKITFNYSDGKEHPVIHTRYSLDGVNFTEGPVITLNPTGVEDEEIPSKFTLYQNYPNPFNPETTIKYAVPKATKVSLKVYNLLGQQVTTLVNDVKEAGVYSVRWNGKNSTGEKVASGIYFYRFKAGNFVQTKKMILLK